jgi:hypothetical protein
MDKSKPKLRDELRGVEDREYLLNLTTCNRFTHIPPLLVRSCFGALACIVRQKILVLESWFNLFSLHVDTVCIQVSSPYTINQNTHKLLFFA